MFKLEFQIGALKKSHFKASSTIFFISTYRMKIFTLNTKLLKKIPPPQKSFLEDYFTLHRSSHIQLQIAKNYVLPCIEKILEHTILKVATQKRTALSVTFNRNLLWIKVKLLDWHLWCFSTTCTKNVKYFEPTKDKHRALQSS